MSDEPEKVEGEEVGADKSPIGGERAGPPKRRSEPEPIAPTESPVAKAVREHRERLEKADKERGW